MVPPTQYTVRNYALKMARGESRGSVREANEGSYRPVVSRARPHQEMIESVVADLDAGREPAPEQVKHAVRGLLSMLATSAPGRSVEVRVPPYGAIQCRLGPRHTRGTPPNVIETDPLTWIRLATGRLSWARAVADGLVRASGVRAELDDLLPVWRDQPR